MNTVNVVEKLIEFKNKYEISVYNISRMSGVNDKTIRNILYGRTYPAVKTCYRLVKMMERYEKEIGKEKEEAESRLGSL